MTTSVFIVESEWDLGESGCAYLSREDALDSLAENYAAIEVAESQGVSVEKLVESNLIRIVELVIE